MHATGPSNRNIIFNFLMEIVGTLVLLIAIVAVGRFVTIPFVVPIVVGLVVAVIGMSLGGTTGYAINPARDLSPRIVHQIMRVSNKGSTDWQYSWIPVVGPLLASVLRLVYLLDLLFLNFVLHSTFRKFNINFIIFKINVLFPRHKS